MKSKRLICLMLCALLLTGCAAQDAPLLAAAPTLAPDSTAFAAPIGDAGLMHSTPAAYVLSSPDGQRLLYTYQDTPLDRSQHPAEAIVSQLLKAESTAAAQAQLAEHFLNTGVTHWQDPPLQGRKLLPFYLHRRLL